MKDLYFQELSEIYQRVAKLPQLQHDVIMPSAKPSEYLKKFKTMLERTLQILQLTKNNVRPSLKDKLPVYERQIVNILASYKKKFNLSQPPGQQQLPHPSGHSQSVPQQQPSQVPQLQQQDNYANQQMNLQASTTSIQPAPVPSMQHSSVSLSGHFGVPTPQPNITNALQTGSTIDAVHGSSFSSFPQGPVVSMQRATLESTAQSGHVGVDLQEEICQKVKAMEDLYFQELSEVCQKIALKLQQLQHDSEHSEEMKNFKTMLERTLQMLQLTKNNVHPCLKDELPVYQRQIVNILSSRKKKVNCSQPPGQQQFPHPSRMHSAEMPSVENKSQHSSTIPNNTNLGYPFRQDDRRMQLQPDVRQRNTNKIMYSLKRHVSISVPEDLNELQKIAIQLEDKIYASATNKGYYTRNITLKLRFLEINSQHYGSTEVLNLLLHTD